MSAQPASHAAKRAIYRALLRNVPWAVGRSCHASKNMKRLIRADFEPIKDANEIDAATAEAREQDFWRKSEGTLLLLLSASAKARKAKEKPPSLALQLSGLASRSDASSSKAPAEPLEAPSKRSLKKAQPLSHRLLRNLASLTYHHLSPHTLMRTRRNNFVGGTASGAARRARARTDAGEPFASLRVTPKPRFGPLLHNRLRRSAWSPVPGEVPALQAASDACHATWKEAKLAGKNEQYVERLWRNFVEERGKLKTAKGRIEKEERKRELQEAPRRLLGGLARCLAERNEFWIGGRRWEKFRKGEWLD